MLILMVLFILIKVTFTDANAGSAIFYNRHTKNGCWNDDDILKLQARKAFEELIPHQVNPDEVDARYIKEVIGYFRKALRLVDKDVDPHKGILLKEAMVDTIGAHLRSEILPTVRFAYYAGYVPYRNARQLHDFMNGLKSYLNTEGLGWKWPERMSQQWSNLTVAKILIGSATFYDPCSCLITKRDSNSCIHLPTPKLDDESEPSAVALPFKNGGLVSLTSPNSNNVLLKYYTTASRCILSSSPEKCRHSDFVSFNNELWHWMKRDVAPHLIDEKLYTAYGGILRIAAAVQNYGKGLSRRNLFEYQEAGLTKWHPWQSLAQSCIYINADWTPKLYVGLVLLTALTIYLLQICYTFVCGDSSGCQCKGQSRSFFSNNVAYANVDTNIPAMLPRQSTVYYSDKKRAKHSSSKTKSASLGSIRTQKVYDMNENTEKLMAVIMSDNEENSDFSQSYSEGDENVERMKLPISPPQLETSMSQLKLDKTLRVDTNSQLPMYSTSTVTRTDETYQGQNASDTVWSATETSTSSHSCSSTSSRKSRSSRDLAWARKVVSKHTSRSINKSTSRTELVLNSCTTPPSQL